jgi:hypothetical protein
MLICLFCFPCLWTQFTKLRYPRLKLFCISERSGFWYVIGSLGGTFSNSNCSVRSNFRSIVIIRVKNCVKNSAKSGDICGAFYMNSLRSGRYICILKKIFLSNIYTTFFYFFMKFNNIVL